MILSFSWTREFLNIEIINYYIKIYIFFISKYNAVIGFLGETLML